MKLRDIMDITLANLLHQKVRSWLTILGIVIGVASIISLISISIGMQENVNAQTSAFGTNQITVTAGSQRAGQMGGMMGGGGGPPPGGGFTQSSSEDPVITFQEAEELRSLSGISAIDAQLTDRSDIVYEDKTISLSVIGTDPEALPEVLTVELEDGRYLSSSDRYSAVVGYSVAHEVFSDDEEEMNLLNKEIEIEDISFKVVGVLEESGGMQGSDNGIYIPIETAKDVFEQDNNVSQLIVVVKEGDDVDGVAAEIEGVLRSLHDLGDDEDPDFSVITATSMSSAVSSITETLTLFLGGIASISLIVGGIGVLNTMYMSVLEQTKTIGVLKALGAKDRDIINL
ncbi:MAG: ABC transporter permease, partial [Candidatus Micrarchaeota archaeon]